MKTNVAQTLNSIAMHCRNSMWPAVPDWHWCRTANFYLFKEKAKFFFLLVLILNLCIQSSIIAVIMCISEQNNLLHLDIESKYLFWPICGTVCRQIQRCSLTIIFLYKLQCFMVAPFTRALFTSFTNRERWCGRGVVATARVQVFPHILM
jgi:hypothetical protein